MIQLSFLFILTVIFFCLLYLRAQKNKKLAIKETFLQKNMWSIKPLSKKEAIIVLNKFITEPYVTKFSLYDIQSKTNSDTSQSIEDYIRYSTKQVLEWSEQEKQQLQKFYQKFMNRLRELNMLQQFATLPSEINIIKSTMKHEGDALGYTVGNTIIIKKANYELFVHELFHIFSRNNHSLRKHIYGILDFKIAHNLILPPTEIKELLISNPDTPQLVFTTINYKNKIHYVTPILHSNKKYNEYTKSFFDDMKVSLLFVNIRVYNDEVILIYKDMSQYGIQNYMIPIEESKEYQEKLGQNTSYTIHPEEVSAKHFESIIQNDWQQKKNPKLIKKLITLLSS